MTGLKRGFTLIELLVVIAIIAILAAILFPVFAQAREKARAITCISNMKQIDLGMLMYVQDYDETYPLSSFYNTVTYPPFGQNSYEWSSQRCLGPYVKNGQIFKCPDDTISGSTSVYYSQGVPTTVTPYPLSYMVNGWSGDAGPSVAPWLDANGNVINGVGLCPNIFYSGGATALAAIPAPADILFMSEGRPTEVTYVYDDTTDWANTELDDYVYSGGLDYAYIYQINYPLVAQPGDTLYPWWHKHSNAINVAFGDGHCKIQRAGDLDTPTRWFINAPNP